MSSRSYMGENQRPTMFFLFSGVMNAYSSGIYQPFRKSKKFVKNSFLKEKDYLSEGLKAPSYKFLNEVKTICA
jgi:hypothetical protein